MTYCEGKDGFRIIHATYDHQGRRLDGYDIDMTRYDGLKIENFLNDIEEEDIN